MHCLPKKKRVEEVGECGMSGKAVWTHARGFIKFLSTLFILETALDHPPPNEALQSSNAWYHHQIVLHSSFQIPSVPEVGHWSKEQNRNAPADYAMRPLNP